MAFGIEAVRQIAERVAESRGLQVWDLELKGGGKSRTLRVYIDRPEGVTHEDCAEYSREISTILDVEDVVPGGPYLLEVSSPGLDRKLIRPEDFARFQGSLVKLTTYELVDGRKHFEGRLTAFANGVLSLDLAAIAKKKKAEQQVAGTVEIAFANVEKANLVPEF